MWIFTKFGFFSVVEHRDNDEVLIVRARRLDHLEKLAEFAHAQNVVPQFQATLDADYPYRFEIERRAFAVVMTELVDDLDYPNFKSSIIDAIYESACHKVWSVMLRIEKPRPLERPRG